MRVLILGATGMLGSTLMRHFSRERDISVVGLARSGAGITRLPETVQRAIRVGIDVNQPDALTAELGRIRPDVIINCVGIVKQHALATEALTSIAINAQLPHRLTALASLGGARLIHVSTDCVFTGRHGSYREDDTPDAEDLYGRSKLLGEVHEPPAITLRTSIIGHELASAQGLVGWFLAQRGTVRGFARAIFSGLPTIELARVITEYVLPRPDLHGLYHVSAAPIAKYELLQLIATQYGLDTTIDRDESFIIDRSLDSTRFRAATGYSPPAWPELIRRMHEFS